MDIYFISREILLTILPIASRNKNIIAKKNLKNTSKITNAEGALSKKRFSFWLNSKSVNRDESHPRSLAHHPIIYSAWENPRQGSSTIRRVRMVEFPRLRAINLLRDPLSKQVGSSSPLFLPPPPATSFPYACPPRSFENQVGQLETWRLILAHNGA